MNSINCAKGGAAPCVEARRIADDSFNLFRRFLRLCIAGALLLSAVGAMAAPLHVAIATPPLPPTFDVALDLIDGGGPANTVTIANLSTDGTFGTATFTGGAGASAGALTLVDGQFFNEIVLPVSAAHTLSFDIDMTMVSPQPGSLPDAFSLFLLDPVTLLPLVTTTDPTGADALFTIQSGDSPLGPFTVFADSGAASSAAWTVAPAAAVPEPASLALIVAGLAALLLRHRRGTAAIRLVGVASLLFPGLVLAAIHVSPSGGTSFPHDGAKWETAFSATELQTAINKNPGAEFWFSKGAYGQLQNVPDGTQLYGGFVGGLLGETSRNERDPAANFTSFDGIIITSYDDGTGTNTKIVQGPNTVVDGFTIAGFGFLLEQASPTLSHNMVIGAPVGIAMSFGAAPVINDSQITGGTYGVTMSGPVQAVKMGPNRVEAKPTINRSTISGGSIGLIQSTTYGKLPTLVVNATTFSGSKAYGMNLIGNAQFSDCIVEKNGNGASAGILVDAGDAGQTIIFERCKIRDNLGTGLLASFISANTNVILRRCEITGNNLASAARFGAPVGGGGVQINGDGVQIIESKIVGNKTFSSGGGVYFASFVNPASRNLIVDSLIAGNGAAMNGGGIAAGRQSFTVVNSTIAGNSAAVGGGIWLEQFDPPNFIPTISFVNTAIVGNLAPLGSATALELLTIAPGNLFHNVVTLSGDTHVSSYNHVVRPPPLGNGSFTVADAGFIAAASGDYRLGASSPLVDRGDSAPINAYIAAGGSATDLGGLPRIAGAAVDVGAYETASAGVTDVTSQVSLRLGGLVFDRASRRYTQVATLANSSGGVLTGPISLVFDGLSAGVTVGGMTNVTVNQAPAGSPYLDVSSADLVPGALITLNLRFDDPLNTALRYVPRVLAGIGVR